MEYNSLTGPLTTPYPAHASPPILFPVKDRIPSLKKPVVPAAYCIECTSHLNQPCSNSSAGPGLYSANNIFLLLISSNSYPIPFTRIHSPPLFLLLLFFCLDV